MPEVTRCRCVHGWLLMGMLWVLSMPALAVSAEDYAQQWGPPLGTSVPLLQAEDQTGTLRTLDNLTGSQGLLLFLVRSADW